MAGGSASAGDCNHLKLVLFTNNVTVPCDSSPADRPNETAGTLRSASIVRLPSVLF
jgi:hypothetical protein